MKKYLPLAVATAVVVAILMALFACDLGALFAWTRPPVQLDAIKTEGEANATVTVVEYSDFQ